MCDARIRRSEHRRVGEIPYPSPNLEPRLPSIPPARDEGGHERFGKE
jgi:hypothetical protein